MKGLTLIELLIAVAILACLFAVAVPNINAFKENSKRESVKIEEGFFTENRYYMITEW